MAFAKNTKKVKIEPLILSSFLAMMRASLGSRLFKKYYAKVNGKTKEVLQDGNLSCAFHITSIMKVFSLIGDTQITVHRAIDDMMRSGWYKIEKPKPGAALVWAEQKADPKRIKKEGDVYVHLVRHLGIYVGNGKAISNSSEGYGEEKGIPTMHNWDNHPVEMILWHPKLDEERPNRKTRKSENNG